MAYFKVKVKHNALTENEIKRSHTTFVGKAETWGDVENQMYKFLAENRAYENPKIISIVPTKIMEIYNLDEDGAFYLIKAKYFELTESGKKIFFTHEFLIESESAATAEEVFHRDYDDGVLDYEVTGNSKTQIMEILPSDEIKPKADGQVF